MTKDITKIQDELSWRDIYHFIQNGWKVIFVFVFLGLIVGVSASYGLTDRYQANALIDPASIAIRNKPGSKSDGTFTTRSVEGGFELSQKMRRISFYSMSTFHSCGFKSHDFTEKSFFDALKIQASRSSRVVSVTFLSSSESVAKSCIESILQDVISNESILFEPHVKSFKADLVRSETDLKSLMVESIERKKAIEDKISLTKDRLKILEASETLLKDKIKGVFDESQFNLAMLLSEKQSQIINLEIRIDSLENNLVTQSSVGGRLIQELNDVVNQLSTALSPGHTRAAVFVHPIEVSKKGVQLKRGFIIIISLLAGFFLGALLLLYMRKNKILRDNSAI